MSVLRNIAVGLMLALSHSASAQPVDFTPPSAEAFAVREAGVASTRPTVGEGSPPPRSDTVKDKEDRVPVDVDGPIPPSPSGAPPRDDCEGWPPIIIAVVETHLIEPSFVATGLITGEFCNWLIHAAWSR